ncbi:hypothetical protein GS399_18740 [Pedobacter sp. HMF7647]|uniref:Uncharacterized protein n=1 Tax=Hufsiella arboris TaxID=2695275 RepID=A0A7K1YEJ7_9SPHI|nr:hypothetical protein [Hufsiella arboris]MXV53012.1 hypothetical protein [Hufsiella arboris]
MLAFCKKKKAFYLLVGLIALVGSFAFRGANSSIEASNQFFSTSFDPDYGKTKLKKWELAITENGFFRLRKTLANGKQEYYSFNLSKFESLDYLGTESSGVLSLKTQSDNIIVQTFNDPAGNIDSMSHQLEVPLRNINLDNLNKLPENLEQIKKSAAY